MLRLRILPFYLVFLQIPLFYAQKTEYSTCVEAVNIFENGDFRIQLDGAEKDREDISRYTVLSKLSEKKHLWLNYYAEQSGELTFNASCAESALQFVVFKAEKNAVCDDLSSGLAEIVRVHVADNSKVVGLDYKPTDGILYALELKEGDRIAVLLATDPGVKANINLSWNFTQKDAVQDSKIVDRRYDDFATTQRFKVIDKLTRKPLIANFSIEGNKDLDGLYIGSEFLFNLDRNAKLLVKCDTEGYFYKDSLYVVHSYEDNEYIIELERVAKGKSISIQSIEFIPGSSEIKESSFSDLRRLRDFLALNSQINIEIQGHVFALGENSLAAQRVSEARAKRVLKYLTDNGIDAKRMSATGYGNTRPLYEKPKFFYEEQANRRVEIVVQ
jgi:flagellar motor protein MotB